MEYTGHIAANHSTWDLEPENLSVESLVLIYADFRVKQSRGEDGREITYISSLDEALAALELSDDVHAHPEALAAALDAVAAALNPTPQPPLPRP